MPPIMPSARMAPKPWRVTLLEIVSLGLAIVVAGYRLLSATLAILSRNYRAVIALAIVYATLSCVASLQR